ncbi:MAG: L-methionine gamma-lyase [Alphaproteobacteria bacterium MarineAlpha5_Bin11]|nr:O-acetylhomoserine aminocarboxypropyltransferase [Pelagibacteraceae bacterium]PPR42833.1 MAG: L-methionine gamma-lyase [Alphaproteobacteria bacterium MarineAlpha5_Bin11]PPR50639.1 MAG: L-methionine gamma-lyase [Alphaproteobacteria bacterium MarineAlpha5_Bin10]|tara:strand:+ start:32230 stop:33540 length:1311 start_codon:yes stop_codon:yes gene_type:complete
MPTTSKHPETIVLHGGSFRKDETTNSVAVPIYQTTSYQFNNAEHASNLFGFKDLGNIYTRIMNPTNAVLEERLAALEGGMASLVVSSGQAASAIALQNLCKSGDNVVSSTDLYGGTWNLFANTFKQLGIEVRFADPADPKNFGKFTDDRTRAYYAETLPNPKLKAFPIEEVSRIGKKYNIPLIMDNTASPITCNPIKHGAAIVVHSLTKYIGGHGTSIGGAIIDSGLFDWTLDPKRQPLLNDPDPSYWGISFGKTVPEVLGAPIAYAVRARFVLLRDLGSAMSPSNSFNFIQGLETLPLRFRLHQDNAKKVANYLKSRSEVVQVIYPGFHKDSENVNRVKKYFEKGNGPLVGFELKGGQESGQQFINNLKLIYHVANIGDSRTLAIHPATTTHSQLSAEDQLKTGVTPGYIRLAVGLEHIDDILEDLNQAINGIKI